MIGNFPAFPCHDFHPGGELLRASGMTFRHYAAVQLLAGMVSAIIVDPTALSDVERREAVREAVKLAGWLCEEIEATARRENPHAAEDREDT